MLPQPPVGGTQREISERSSALARAIADSLKDGQAPSRGAIMARQSSAELLAAATEAPLHASLLEAAPPEDKKIVSEPTFVPLSAAFLVLLERDQWAGLRFLGLLLGSSVRLWIVLCIV